MSRRHRLFGIRISVLFLASAAIALAAPSFASLPRTLSYQGYLRDNSGVPVSASTSITFSLYSSNPARSNPVWRETQSVTPANGLYSTQLGSVTPITAPFDVPYWLGVKVASDPEMALQPLSSTGYAVRAAVANSVTTGAITDNQISGQISPAKGGTGFNSSSAAAGSLLTTTGTGTWGTLAPGANGQVLQIAGGVPAWGSAGTVTSVATGTGLTGGPVTMSGTVSIDTAVVPRLSASNTFTQPQTVQNGAGSAAIPLTVRGNVSQTANLQEWQNSAGTAVATVSPTGVISGNGSGLTNVTPADGSVTDAKISGTISMAKRPMSVYPFSYGYSTVTPAAFSYIFVGTPLTITTPYYQKLIGSASATGYVNSGSYAVDYGLCYRPNGSANAPNNFTNNAPYVTATGISSTFSIASSIDLPAGTWDIGFCVGNNANSFTINMLDINGWIMVTN